MNGQNLLVEEGRVTGIIDFNDTIFMPYAFDISVLAAYIGSNVLDAFEGGSDVELKYHEAITNIVEGYRLGAKTETVLDELRSSMFSFMVMRLSQSIVNGLQMVEKEPENEEYFLIDARPAIRHLKFLMTRQTIF